jgi:hypothetical protein
MGLLGQCLSLQHERYPVEITVGTMLKMLL